MDDPIITPVEIVDNTVVLSKYAFDIFINVVEIAFVLIVFASLIVVPLILSDTIVVVLNKVVCIVELNTVFVEVLIELILFSKVTKGTSTNDKTPPADIIFVLKLLKLTLLAITLFVLRSIVLIFIILIVVPYELELFTIFVLIAIFVFKNVAAIDPVEILVTATAE